MRDKIFAIYKRLFSDEDVIIRIKKSSLTSFVLGFVFAAPIFIGGSWLVGSGQAQVDDSAAKAAVVNEEDSAGEEAAGPVNLEVKENDYILGNKDAAVTLVVFSDLQCPYCARHHDTIKTLAQKYPNDIRIVWRHFPLSFHEYANAASNAAECAGEQGKFWEFIDKAFESQDSFSDEIWAKLAGDLKLNASKFSKCVSDKKYNSKISEDMSLGSSSGVQGTPATFVNGNLISGAVPASTFEAEIDKLLE